MEDEGRIRYSTMSITRSEIETTDNSYTGFPAVALMMELVATGEEGERICSRKECTDPNLTYLEASAWSIVALSILHGRK